MYLLRQFETIVTIWVSVWKLRFALSWHDVVASIISFSAVTRSSNSLARIRTQASRRWSSCSRTSAESPRSTWTDPCWKISLKASADIWSLMVGHLAVLSHWILILMCSLPRLVQLRSLASLVPRTRESQNFFLSPFPIHRTYFWVSPPQMALLGFFHANSLFFCLPRTQS